MLSFKKKMNKLKRYKDMLNDILLDYCCIFLIEQIILNRFLFFVRNSFGKRNGGSVRRPNECFVLETSEMIVVSNCFIIFYLDLKIYVLFIGFFYFVVVGFNNFQTCQKINFNN